MGGAAKPPPSSWQTRRDDNTNNWRDRGDGTGRDGTGREGTGRYPHITVWVQGTGPDRTGPRGKNTITSLWSGLVFFSYLLFSALLCSAMFLVWSGLISCRIAWSRLVLYVTQRNRVGSTFGSTEAHILAYFIYLTYSWISSAYRKCIRDPFFVSPEPHIKSKQTGKKRRKTTRQDGLD